MPSATLRNLSVLSYANGFTLYHYRSAEHTMGEIAQLDYFADALHLKSGDVIICQDSSGRTFMRSVHSEKEGAAGKNRSFLAPFAN